MTAEDDVWGIPQYLTGIARTPLLHPDLRRRLNRVDARVKGGAEIGRAALKADRKPCFIVWG
jgi:hypothetical protein